MTILEILVIVWISLQLLAGVVSFILVVVFDKKDQKRENHGAAIGSPYDEEEPERSEDFECYFDCCYQQDHVCTNPEGICGDQTKED